MFTEPYTLYKILRTSSKLYYSIMATFTLFTTKTSCIKKCIISKNLTMIGTSCSCPFGALHISTSIKRDREDIKATKYSGPPLVLRNKVFWLNGSYLKFS